MFPVCGVLAVNSVADVQLACSIELVKYTHVKFAQAVNKKLYLAQSLSEFTVEFRLKYLVKNFLWSTDPRTLSFELNFKISKRLIRRCSRNFYTLMIDV